MLKGEAGARYFDKNRHFLSALLAMDLRSIFHIITLKDTDDIFIYNPKTGLYEGLGNKTLKEKIKFVLGNCYSEPHAKATIDDIKACKYTDRKDFTAPIQFIPVENGILDISKNPVELIDYSEKFYFTKKLSVTYKPEAKCPNFLKFLSEILPENKFRLQIQEMFGWCLWRKYSHQVAFMLVGEGSNGKSTLLAVLRFLLGNQNVTSISLQDICGDRFASADLYQKFANIAGETRTKKLEETEIFKSLTDGLSFIRVQRKFGQPFEFGNYAKLIFAMNEVPPTKDRTNAFYRRWVIIFFIVKFGDNGLPKDNEMIEKITTPDELSGILNWSIEGLQRLNKQGGFSEKMSDEETENCYERLSNSIGTFLTEHIEETDNDEDCIAKDYLCSDLLYYCEKNRLPKPTSKKLAQEIKTHFENVVSVQRKVGKKERAHVWANCRYKDGSIANIDYATWVEEQ